MRACELLRHSSLNIAQTAAACGFVDASYFTRMFRVFTGKTLRAFRDGRALPPSRGAWART